MDIPWLREPVEDPLEKLRLELHNQWLAFNRELKRGTLKHLDYDKKLTLSIGIGLKATPTRQHRLKSTSSYLIVM